MNQNDVRSILLNIKALMLQIQAQNDPRLKTAYEDLIFVEDKVRQLMIRMRDE